MIEVKFEREKNRSAAYDNGAEIGECTFSSSDKIWIIDHTFVDSIYGGQGIARKLVDAVVDAARSEGVKLSATCPYAIKVFKEDKYSDILV